MDCCNMNDISEVLNFAVKNGIINVDSIKKDVEKMSKEKILNDVHKYAISKRQSKSGKYTYDYWFTYVPDANSKTKRKLLKRKTKEDLIDALLEYYNIHSNDNDIITFKDEYELWVKFKKNIVTINTIRRYEADYKRFFAENSFEKKDIKSITGQDIILFLSNNVKEKALTQKTFMTLNGYIKEIFESALNNRHIDSNPYLYISNKLKLVKNQCVKNIPKTAEERTISDEEAHKLLEKLNESYKNSPEYIVPYAVEFAMYTGCRVGEIAALKWNDIKEDKIIISHSEKAQRRDNGIKYSIESTKTGKIRVIPLVDAIKNLLFRVKKAETAINVSSEFVFCDKNGRIAASRISNCIQKKSVQAGIDKKSINDCRRTVNSKLKYLGLDVESAASMLGHTVKVNMNNYSYDMSNLSEKYEYLNQVCGQIMG